jgi:hypothetical protein
MHIREKMLLDLNLNSLEGLERNILKKNEESINLSIYKRFSKLFY